MLKATETEGLSNAKVVGRYLFINNEKLDCRNIPEYLKLLIFLLYFPYFVALVSAKYLLYTNFCF